MDHDTLRAKAQDALNGIRSLIPPLEPLQEALIIETMCGFACDVVLEDLRTLADAPE